MQAPNLFTVMYAARQQLLSYKIGCACAQAILHICSLMQLSDTDKHYGCRETRSPGHCSAQLLGRAGQTLTGPPQLWLLFGGC